MRSTALSSPPLICFLSSLFSLRSFWISACSPYYHWTYSDGHLTGDQLPIITSHDCRTGCLVRVKRIRKVTSLASITLLSSSTSSSSSQSSLDRLPAALVNMVAMLILRDTFFTQNYVGIIGTERKPRIMHCKGRQVLSCPRSELQMSSFYVLGICPEHAHNL